MAGKSGKLTSPDDVIRVERRLKGHNDLMKGNIDPGKMRKVFTDQAVEKKAVMAEVERTRPGFMSKGRKSK